MEKASIRQKGKSAANLTAAGMSAKILLSLTQLIPTLRFAGYAVFVGVACFFVAEAIEKTPKSQSALRFGSFWSDLKKPTVLLWVLLPVVTAIVPILLGDLNFDHAFSAHVVGRVDGMLSFENILLLVCQVVILALGEEIAWRGFFLERSMRRFPFLLCAVVSSVLFAMGHISDAGIALLLYDLSFVLIDSILFSVIYKKSGNCLVSAASHVLGNAVGLMACLLL